MYVTPNDLEQESDEVESESRSSTFPEILMGYLYDNQNEEESFDEEEMSDSYFTPIAESTANSEQDFKKMTLMSLEKTTLANKQVNTSQKTKSQSSSSCCLLI